MSFKRISKLIVIIKNKNNIFLIRNVENFRRSVKTLLIELKVDIIEI